MSIPGLGQAQARATAPAPASAIGLSAVVGVPVIHDIEANSEWRFEVAAGQAIEVRIISGTAELFGTELALSHTYTFRSTKSAIFTWHGCKIQVTGSCVEYTAEETPMVSYANTHFALEKLRDEAQDSNKEGPRVLVVGPRNSGKTSLVKLLTAYAVRQGRQPMVINTDSREGLLSIPGSLTATPFASILDIEEGWGSSPTSGPSPVPVKMPLCYYYGQPHPEDNPKLYKPVITRLALAASSRINEDTPIKNAGMIIDTPGTISQGKDNFDLLAHIVSEFSVNIILTVGSERLQSELKRRFENSKVGHGEHITLVKLDKSGGCVDRDDEFSKQSREDSLREYFFGDPKRTLSPQTQQINFSDITIYKIHEESTNSAFLPGDAENDSVATSSALFEKIEPSPNMLHSILAVMYASLHDSQDTIRDAPVMGFVYVAEVKASKLRLLAPLNARIVDRPMVWGSWPEATGSLMHN